MKIPTPCAGTCRIPIGEWNCFESTLGSAGTRQAHAAFPAPEDFADHLYVHYDREAAQHLLSVTTGLDSAVLGESEVQRLVNGLGERGDSAPRLVERALCRGGRRAWHRNSRTGCRRALGSELPAPRDSPW